MYPSVIRICLAFALFNVAFAEIPSYIKVCYRNDTEIAKCISNSIDQLREKLAVGIPELNVPSIEPLVLKTVRLLRGPNNAKLDINLTNLEIYGPHTFKILDLKTRLNKNLVITFKLLFEKLDIRGKYQMDAQLLLLKLIGNDRLTGELRNYEFNGVLKLNKLIKDNKTYLKVEKMKIIIRIGKSRINFENLFNGDPILGPAANDIINTNSNLLVEELKPALEEALENVFTDAANKILMTATYDELLPIK